MLISFVSINQLAVDILPRFKTFAVQVLTLYPVMPTEVVEKDVTSRIEVFSKESQCFSCSDS